MFAFGDFAFNLFWQSIMLFLLFYYTDALGLPIGVAATTYLVASVWDGIANFIAGILVDRKHDRFRYGLLAAGAVPLGLTFVLTYMPPLASGGGGLPGVHRASAVQDRLCRRQRALSCNDCAGQRRSRRPRFRRRHADAVRDRSRGHCRADHRSVGRWLTGSSAAQAYFGAAILFAIVGAAILALVGATYREAAVPHRPQPSDSGRRSSASRETAASLRSTRR